ncbi:MAG: L,D-transpeptidase family protein [Gammaproteobacteria bacterium]|nr:L,D-transpeptidase family protein [Gammaproteobacteria bacterium]
MRIRLSILATFLSCLISGQSVAEVYPLRSQDDSVIGELIAVTAAGGETLPDIARMNGFGYSEIKLINPGIDTWLPGAEEEIILPGEFILPVAPREGIVLNIPEMRLYYFPPRKGNRAQEVVTYPIGIGREGWNTPYVATRVNRKDKDPIWYPPESIREEHAAEGRPLPKIVRPGPDNPMGAYAMRLALPAYAIHGTNKPLGVGMRVSHGCIRLYPEDIEELFAQVKPGTPVHIVNQPYKVGRRGDRLFLEAHPYLEEDQDQFSGNLTSVVKMILAVTGELPYDVDWNRAKQVIQDPAGIPIEIGRVRVAPVQTMADASMKAVELPPQPGLELRLETHVPGAASESRAR